MNLAVVELIDGDGRARHVIPVTRWPVTVGRAVDCDIVLDDAFVAAHHVTLDDLNGRVGIQVGECVNGAQLPHRQLNANEQAELTPGQIFQIGATRLRVRLASDAIAPERRLERERLPSVSLLAVLVAALMVMHLVQDWIASDPNGRVIDYLPTIIGLPLAVAIWSAFWSLGSKLFRHRFDFRKHLRIAAWCLIGVFVVGYGLPVLAFAFGWPFLSRIASTAAFAVVCGMVAAHLVVMLPSRRRLWKIGMSVVFIATTAVAWTRSYQANDHLFGELYVSTLAPPALRLVSGESVGDFIEDAGRMKASLDARMHDSESDSTDTFDDEE